MTSAHIGDPHPWTTCSPRCTVRFIKPELMIKVHIGCFDVSLAGWCNTDITTHIVVARISFLVHVLYFFGLIDQKRFHRHTDRSPMEHFQ